MAIDRALLKGAEELATATLQGAAGLPTFPPDIERTFGAAMDELPPQCFVVGRYQQSARWFELAALIELAGLWDQSLALLEAITEAVDASLLAVSVDSIAGAEARAILALVCARRARVLRMSGQLESAEEWYMQALPRRGSIPEDAFWADIYPSAHLGRYVAAVERGNYPEARRIALKCLRKEVSKAMHAMTYQALALIDHKTGRYDRALHHLWQAHDLIERHPTHKVEIESTLAEVAFKLGDTCSALRGWGKVLAQTRVARIAAPALVGVLDSVAWQLQHGDRCGGCAAFLRSQAWFSRLAQPAPNEASALEAIVRSGSANGSFMLFDGDLTPHDRVELRLAHAMLLSALGDRAAGATLAREVREDALQFGFHERVFQSEALVARVAVADSAAAAERHTVVARRAKADLARLFALGTAGAGIEVSST